MSHFAKRQYSVVDAIACQTKASAGVIGFIRRTRPTLSYAEAVSLRITGVEDAYPMHTLPQRTGGRTAQRMLPLAELEAAGWRVTPVPKFYALHRGAAHTLHWGSFDWVVTPPVSSDEPAKRFDGRGKAQLWATEQLLASRQAEGAA